MSKIRLQTGQGALPLTTQLAAAPAFRLAVESDFNAGARRSAEKLHALIASGHCKLTTVRLARLEVEKQLKGQSAPEQESEAPTATFTPEKFELRDNGATGEVLSQSFDIKTVDELMASGKVDLSVWEPHSPHLKAWGVMCKDNDGQMVTRTLYSVSAKLRRNHTVGYAKAVVDALMQDLRKAAPKIPRTTRPKTKTACCLEVGIFDLHMDKLCWGRETGEDYDTEIAKTEFMRAIEVFLNRSASFPIGEILFPIGNDYFNTDSFENTTTAGTRQDVDSRWQKSFVEGHRLIRRGIEMLREVAPVRVLVVPGNHDSQKTYFLGEVISAVYENCRDVTVDNSPRTRKYHEFGQCLIGFSHGNEEKPASLPLIMAQEMKDAWARTIWREWHCGHFHTRQETSYQPVAEIDSVTIRKLSSLSGRDAWHYRKGYQSLRAAQAFVLEPECGVVAQFNHAVRASGGC